MTIGTGTLRVYCCTVWPC